MLTANRFDDRLRDQVADEPPILLAAFDISLRHDEDAEADLLKPHLQSHRRLQITSSRTPLCKSKSAMSSELLWL